MSRSPLDRHAWREGLDQIRGLLRDRLDAIEKLAREAIRNAEEGAEKRLRAERESIRGEVEAEHATMIERLENDRQLLAEAWDRLEREQIDHLSLPRATPSPEPASPAASLHPATPTSEDRDDAVARSILKQFQALKRDVRNHSTRGLPQR